MASHHVWALPLSLAVLRLKPDPHAVMEYYHKVLRGSHFPEFGPIRALTKTMGPSILPPASYSGCCSNTHRISIIDLFCRTSSRVRACLYSPPSPSAPPPEHRRTRPNHTNSSTHTAHTQPGHAISSTHQTHTLASKSALYTQRSAAQRSTAQHSTHHITSHQPGLTISSSTCSSAASSLE
jgi:hypothetical protein